MKLIGEIGINKVNNMKYRIIKEEWLDLHSVPDHTGYYIKIKKVFLGIEYWSYFKELDCIYGDCYKSKVKFKSLEEAERYIKEILCPGKPVEKWVTTVCKELSC